jgi:hypothetical protein
MSRRPLRRRLVSVAFAADLGLSMTTPAVAQKPRVVTSP